MRNILKDFIHHFNVMNTISGGVSAASVNIENNQDNITIHIQAPSVSTEAFNIFVRAHQLVVYAILKDEENEWSGSKEKIASRHMVPIFSRVFDIPPFVKEEEIDAVFEYGKLKIILPFQESTSIPVKRIDIREY